jgi:hypothetical protein
VEPIGGSNPGYDVVTKRGEKVQVKGLRMTDPHRSTLSPVRSPDYDYLIAVRFERDFTLRDAWRFTRAVVEELARWSDHVNGYVLNLRPGVLARGEQLLSASAEGGPDRRRH